MNFARRVFLAAAIYGLIVLLPMYFLESKTGRDPVRYCPIMIPAILEKAAFGVPAIILFVLDRLSPQMLAAGMIDLILGVLFGIAYARTGGGG